MGASKFDFRKRARHRSRGVRARREKVPEQAKPYASNDELLEGTRQVFKARQRLRSLEDDLDEDADLTDVREQEALWTGVFHRSVDLTGNDVELARVVKEKGLSEPEREILLALVLKDLGLFEEGGHDVPQLLTGIGVAGVETLGMLRLVSEEGRLFQEKLIFHADPELSLREREVLADPALAEAVLYENGGSGEGWDVRTEKELHRKIVLLSRAFKLKADVVEGVEVGYENAVELHRAGRNLTRQMDGFAKTLHRHRSWKLHELMANEDLDLADKLCLLILMGKELGHLEADDGLYRGRGMARVLADDPGEVHAILQSMNPDWFLFRLDLIRPCGGPEEILTSDPRVLGEVEFELTDRGLRFVGLDRSLVKKRKGSEQVREPVVTLDRLVLAPAVLDALSMVQAQVCHAGVLMNDWGLAKAIPYGRTVTLLFSGPPGTGKTACAEGLAHALSMPILVADYSNIQNCFVGNTEKNIVKTFRDARASGALLFWDEADAMFFDRDSSSRNWEVRDVNVLLQELERFEGLCVLATNREVTLDKALERRVAIKVAFERPDREQRLAIWRKIVPEKMPLAPDVDFGLLADLDLSGGEIKNALLNAARRAVARDPEGRVTLDDFVEAVGLEQEGQWTGGSCDRIGFARIPGDRCREVQP